MTRTRALDLWTSSVLVVSCVLLCCADDETGAAIAQHAKAGDRETPGRHRIKAGAVVVLRRQRCNVSPTPPNLVRPSHPVSVCVSFLVCFVIYGFPKGHGGHAGEMESKGKGPLFEDLAGLTRSSDAEAICVVECGNLRLCSVVCRGKERCMWKCVLIFVLRACAHFSGRVCFSFLPMVFFFWKSAAPTITRRNVVALWIDCCHHSVLWRTVRHSPRGYQNLLSVLHRAKANTKPPHRACRACEIRVDFVIDAWGRTTRSRP